MTKEMMEIEYNRGRNLLETDKIENLEEAIKVFTNLEDYKESAKFLNQAKEKYNGLKMEFEEQKEEDYQRALMLMKEKKSAQRLDQAIKLFTSLEGYKDSNEQKEICLKYREKVMINDKTGLDRLKLTGYLFAGIGIIVIAIVICAVIWTLVSNGGE